MKLNIAKSFSVIMITLLLLITLIIAVNATDYNGSKLKAQYDTFLANPGNHELEKLLQILPNKREKIGDHQVMDYIFMNLEPLEALAWQGNSIAIDVLFKMLYLTDAAYSEQLSIILGLTINDHPREFLNSLTKNYQINGIKRLDSLLGNLGEDYVDEFEKQLVELEKRYQKIKQTKNVSEKIKSLCLYELSEQIYETRSYLLEMNGYKKITY